MHILTGHETSPSAVKPVSLVSLCQQLKNIFSSEHFIQREIWSTVVFGPARVWEDIIHKSDLCKFYKHKWAMDKCNRKRRELETWKKTHTYVRCTFLLIVLFLTIRDLLRERPLPILVPSFWLNKVKLLLQNDAVLRIRILIRWKKWSGSGSVVHKMNKYRVSTRYIPL